MHTLVPFHRHPTYFPDFWNCFSYTINYFDRLKALPWRIFSESPSRIVNELRVETRKNTSISPFWRHSFFHPARVLMDVDVSHIWIGQYVAELRNCFFLSGIDGRHITQYVKRIFSHLPPYFLSSFMGSIDFQSWVCYFLPLILFLRRQLPFKSIFTFSAMSFNLRQLIYVWACM